MNSKEEFLWVEKYRPKTVSDVILSNELKKPFIDTVSSKVELSNSLFAGTPGTGKCLHYTTEIDIYVSEADYVKYNFEKIDLAG